MTEKPE